MSNTVWTPLFKGIDHSVGTNFGSTTVTNNGAVFTVSTLQSVHCLKIDLSDPSVQLFTTPKATNYVAESRETLSLSISNYIKNFGVAVAVDGNFYNGTTMVDPSSEGLPCEVYGLMICTGQVVSVADTGGSGGGRFASLMFTTNKVPIFNFDNRPPGTNTDGIYTAVTGFYPLLTNGVNMWALYYSTLAATYNDPSIHAGNQPRTALGISQDQRYLYLMTIDGRQSTYSNGALDAETAMWLLQFGAWDAINMDGGGSTAMYMATCGGNPVPLNHSSFPLTVNPPRERYIGAHFGVIAQPFSSFISGIAAVPGGTTAVITWTTVSNSTSQVDYGLTSSFGTLSALDPTPVTNHTVVLSGLTSATQYFFRVLSSDGTTLYTSGACGGVSSFVTTNNTVRGMIYGLTNAWKYTTNNLDGTNWQASGYDDSGWLGPGRGVFFVDTTYPTGYTAIQPLPLNTAMPPNPATNYPFVTYYFRTHFNFSNGLAGATLTFSNFLDDGAAFYLNGVEISRLLLATGATNRSPSTGFYCVNSPPGFTGDATCPYVFTISGNLATNLRSGDNVVAVEVHNIAANSRDVTFGQALFFTAPPLVLPPAPVITNLVVTPGETTAIITWTTLSNATSQVRYGLTPSLESSNALDSTLVTNHSMTLTGLSPLTNYYFRVMSSAGGVLATVDDVFSTTLFYVRLVSPTNTWSYTSNNLDAVNWTAPSFDDSGWLGTGPALLFIETNPAVAPRNTPLPSATGGLPYPTYYFRGHFTFNTNLAGLSLVLTNYIDDGAIFYLNGTEIQRVRMPAVPQAVVYSTLATDCPHPADCDAVTNAPDVFRLSGDAMTNLLVGADNVLAVEVHQLEVGSPDVVFGSSVGLSRVLVSEARLRIQLSGRTATVSWDGTGFTLQQALGLAGSSWGDAPGAAATSPYVCTNPPAFFRLRN